MGLKPRMRKTMKDLVGRGTRNMKKRETSESS